MSDCRFGVSPVNYPDPDPDPDSDFMKTYDVLLLSSCNVLIRITNYQQNCSNLSGIFSE